MKVEQRTTSRADHLVLTDLAQKVFVRANDGNEIWVSTAYGQIRIGVGEVVYQVVGGALIRESKAKGEQLDED